MDAAILKELALWATAGGGGLFLALKLLQKIGSGVRAAVAADDKSVSLLDRMERQLAGQELRLQAAEDRRLAQVRALEQRAAAASAHAAQAGRERDDALARIERLSFVVLALREDLRRLQAPGGKPGTGVPAAGAAPSAGADAVGHPQASRATADDSPIRQAGQDGVE